MVQEIVGKFIAGTARFGLVVSRFNAVVTDRLEAGALDALRRHGVGEERLLVARVPGAFEIPSVARLLLHEGRCDAVLGIGCILRGDTPHFDYVCEAAVGGLAAIGRETGRPVACGVLTCDTLEQALQRAGGKAGNKGFEAALAALESASLARELAR
ncbi:MAG: 6,7-dimethyl-8-ribityllumazine synthase [Planctomycetaceae bacterium]